MNFYLFFSDDVFTILTLRTNLVPYMDKIHTLNIIHKDCILDWHSTPANVCVTNLLTKLYNNCHIAEAEIASFSFIIFVNCIKVYLNIITLWLNSGGLEDWQDEFTIAR